MFRLTAIIFILIYMALPALAGVRVMDSQFHADVPFPEYAPFWKDSSAGDWMLGPDGGAQVAESERPLGGNVHIYVRNTGTEPITIQDVLLEGISLKSAIAYSTKRKYKGVAYAASIHFSDLPQAEKDKLIALGEPVWYKAEPESIAPSATAEVTIRLRHMPKPKQFILALKTSAGTVPVSVSLTRANPRIESISFSRDLKQVYLYVRPSNGLRDRFLMDGQVVSADIGRDPAVDVTPIVCTLKAPLVRGSYHTFQAVYTDGSTAVAGVRAYADETMYGMWGARPGRDTELEVGRAHIEDMGVHNLNLEMPVIGSDAVRKFMMTPEGRALMQKLGIRQIVEEPEKAVLPPWAYYLADEPDTADYRVTDLPSQSRVGAIAQGLIEHASALRKIGPETPNMLNVDMTFKPDNWYTYGQLADIYAADPYFQTRLAQAYMEKPGTLPLYSKATFVYAVGSICRSACAPKPLHLMLNSTKIQKGDRVFRFGTPQEKRIELYYALASGAKSISYWWFIPLKPGGSGSSGCGADEPEAKALWDEIGLLGAEVRTIDPLLARSCPAKVPVTAPRGVWVRTLLVGKDSLIVLCVNDDYLCDRLGTVIKPQENVKLSLNLPTWLSPKSVFQIDCRGTHAAEHTLSGSKLSLDLGTVDVTRMIVISVDPAHREQLQKTYDTGFAANVRKLLEVR